jgi:dipeptidase E
MKHLFLTSQGFQVIGYIGKQLGEKVKLPMAVITTATEDRAHSWLQKNRDEMDKAGYNYQEYTFTGKTTPQIAGDLAQFQMIYVLGGNAFYLLEQIQKSGCADYLHSRVGEGMIYIGHSAGSVIAGPDIAPIARAKNTDLAPDLRGTEGLGLVNFVTLPHFGTEDRRDLYLSERLPLAYNFPYPYLLINDNQYVEVTNQRFQIIDITHES